MNFAADDIDQLMAVMAAAFDPAFGEAWSRRQVEDALVVGRCSYRLICAAGGNPEAGAAAAGFYLSRTAFDEEELLLLAVDPSARRRGLGQTLIDWLRTDARERGARRLLLEMRRGNPAERLYCRNGFAVIGERPGYYQKPDGQRTDAITFSCQLD